VSHERVQALLKIADDELILGWRDSEWTGIAPTLEEDVAFSSIAQNEIGHARALYELAARDLGTDADSLAFDRSPDEYVNAPLVELRRLDWAHTIARHWLYETADELRLAQLKESDDPEVAGLAAKMDREEVYHRLHAQMWAERLQGNEQFNAAVKDLYPFALGVLDGDLRSAFSSRVGLSGSELQARERGEHSTELQELWDEMTMVRRSVPGATW
jgi:ring-1,2-phenylacetyl-CoA epoxidase subunit PaaC